MRSSLEGQFRPGGGISFDAANTMNGGYAEATPEAKRGATAVVEAFVPPVDIPDVLAMLGLLPPQPGEV